MVTPLAAYLERNDIGDAEFAELIDRDRSIVSKIRRGVVRPTLEMAGRIESVTRGEVSMQSWVEGDGDSVALCGRCGERSEAAVVTSCTSTHCPLRAREAA